MKAILACAVVLAIGGCGGGTRLTPTPTPTVAVDPAVVVSRAPDAVKAAIIGAADLPGGWSGRPRDPVGELGLSPQCRELDSDGFDGQLAYAASDRLTGPQKDNLHTDASAFATDQAAQDAMDRIRRTLSSCHDEYAAAIVRLQRKNFIDDGGSEKQLGDMSVAISEEPGAPTGDSSFDLVYQFHVVVDGKSNDFATHLMTFRVGRMVATVGYDPGASDGQLQKPVVELAAIRLTKANATLIQ